MKKQYIYSALVLTALLCAGCAKEFKSTPDDRDSVAIELSSVSTDPMTKAVITGTEFTTSEAEAGIGLFLLDGSGNAYGSNPTNVKYTFSSDKWTAASPLRVGGTAGTLYGYYPYSSTVTDITAIPVASSVNGTDYLYATPTDVSSTDAKNVSLSLSHALARVSLSFRLDGSYEGDGALSAISLSGDCVAANGTLNAKTGGINASKAAFSADGLDRTVTKSGSTVVECLVVPVANESGTPELRIACTIDGKAYATTFTGNLAAIAQGRQTTIDLTVKNTSVTVDGTSIGAWGEGGSQTVTVGGDYTVTVKLHKGTPASDVILFAGLDVSNNSVNILTSSKSKREFICILDDGNIVEPIVDGNYYKFIISDVTKDITATIRYESYKLKAFVYPSYSGTISEYETEHQPGDNVTLEVTSSGKLGNGGKFVGWKDKDGNLISEQTSINFDIESDAFPIAVFDVNYGSDAPLGGVFTVAADKGDGKPKKVRFSKGNLYCSGASFDENSKCTSVSDGHWSLEQYQYNCGEDWDGSNRISHFLWSTDCMRSLDKTYDRTGASDQDVFFTNSTNFAVNGVSAWHTLSQPEWAYLLGDSAERSGKYRTRVTVNGVMGLVIAPDKFSGTIGNTYDATDWATAEINDGLVFLPAAGFRDGNSDNTFVNFAGMIGYYWSASSSGDDLAFVLLFNSGLVDPSSINLRFQAYSVRLVTESK